MQSAYLSSGCGQETTIEGLLATSIIVHLEPVQHWSARNPWDWNKALWGAFVLETLGGNLYFTGDSGYGDGEFFIKTGEKFGPFRLAMIPIGVYLPRWFQHYYHIEPEQSVQAFLSLKAINAIGIHFGTFQLADEGHEDPQLQLEQMKQQYGVEKERFRALQLGEAWEVP